ncbi:MAG: HAMP domain-containing histidine kinase, partial [Solirubrobacterales bacterium]|nr:HAMP domain-containing histidine kinase [Solirubrobacterales bacterium]
FLVSGIALLGTTYLIFRSSTGVDLIVPTEGAHRSIGPGALNAVRRMYAAVERNTHGLHQGAVQSGVALAIMTLVSIALGWLVAGRVLRPLRTMTATTRRISERNLSERLAVSGPRDELKDLADTVDGLLARLEAHVAEAQRFAANASHELRTPLAITQTLLDVARNDSSRENDELVDRLHAVNTRALDLTEALLLLSRADQRSFTPEHVDLSLIAEEATEALLPLAEKHGVTVDASGAMTPTIGSLVTGENTGEKLTPQLVCTLGEPFLRGTDRLRTDHAGVGLGLAIVNSITQAHDGTLTLTPRADGGLRATVRLPAAHQGSYV